MKTRAAGFEPAPSSLVTAGRQRLGRFDSAPNHANLIDAEYRGYPRPLRWLRLKEWQAFQIATEDLFLNVALFDAKLMSLLQVKVFDHRANRKFVHERKLRPGAFRVAEQLLDSRTAYRDRRSSLSFENQIANGRIEIAIDLVGSDDCPSINGRLRVDTHGGASQVVSLPFEGDVGMYSHKGMFPIEGELRVGADLHALVRGEALALMDDHKGYYPYVMQWDWVTSANPRVGSGGSGFNLTRNQCREPDTFNENCGWVGNQIGRLPAVHFVRREPRHPNEQWIIKDREGRVDLEFRPTIQGDVRVNALIVESRYRGPFGRFRGRLEPEGLEPILVEDWFGMGEEFWLRC